MNSVKRLVQIAAAFLLVALIFTIANPSALHAVVSTLVQITNTSANPVPVKSIDERGRNAVSATVEMQFSNDPDRSFADIYAVPAGQQLVIEYVGFDASLPQGGDQISSFQVNCVGPGSFLSQNFRFKPETTNFNAIGVTDYLVNEHVTLYCAPGQTVNVAAFKNGSANNNFVIFPSIEGYLVSLN